MRVLGFLILVLCGLLSACGIQEDEQVRKPVPPKASDQTSMPWNVPTQGGGGVLGGLLGGGR